jgi:uncharacterized integral membrane protein
MAHPHHVEVLDSYDRWSVRLYRFGLIGIAGGLAALSWALLAGRDSTYASWLLLAGTALAVAHLHLYAKRIKHVIALGAWVAVVLGALPLEGATVQAATLGFASIALSGLALKEQFCFRIPFLRLQPVCLGAAVFGWLAGAPLVAGISLAAAALLQTLLAFAKLRMPLHYDIGDKSAYQV